MIDLQIVSDFVNENFERVSISKNGTHFLARCVLCGDSKKNPRKKRFNLDYNGGNPMYHCFNCDDSGSFVQLYGLLNGMNSDEVVKELFGFDVKRISRQLSERKIEKIVKEIKFEDHNWIYNDCYMVNDEHCDIMSPGYVTELKKFINDRKIPEEYVVMIAYKGDYKGRVIIPIFDKNKDVIFFQARRLPGSDLFPKYKNPTIAKGSVILNKHRFDPDKHVIVTEGLIDAFMLGKQGTTALGASYSEEFLSEIFKITNKVILAFDNDEAGYKSMLRFMMGYKKRKKRRKIVPPNKFHKRVQYFLYPSQFADCKDINNIKSEYNLDDVYKMVISNSYSFAKTYAMLHFKKDYKKIVSKLGGNSVDETNKNRNGLCVNR